MPKTEHFLWGVLLMAVGGGCVPDLVTRPAQDPAELFWALKLNHRAITLDVTAPYDTVQLVATPKNVDGIPLTAPPAVRYSTLDTTIRLSPTGFVRASSVTASTGARVIASLTVNGVSLADTAFIRVTKNLVPSLLDTFAITRVVGDSAKVAFGMAAPTLSVTANNDAGASMSPPVYYRSLNERVATINRVTGAIKIKTIGKVTFIVTSRVYGDIREDSLPFTVGFPLLTIVAAKARPSATGTTPLSYFDASVITLGVGGEVNFLNMSGRSVDIVFDTPSAVAGTTRNGQSLSDSGNIAAFESGSPSLFAGASLRARRFPVAGTYHFRSTLYPEATGTILVKAE